MSTNEVFLEHDTTAEDLAAQLPTFMPKDPNSGNYRLLKTVAGVLDIIRDDIEAVDFAMNVQTAQSMGELDKLGELVDLHPYENETVEHFRARLIAEYQLVTGEGTIRDLLQGAAAILDVDSRNLDYAEPTLGTNEHGTMSMTFPVKTLDASELTDSELANILDQLVPAGYRLDALKKGTFTYISESDYQAANFDPDLGYDGLDGSGNPKDNGGTYSGILR